MSDFTEAEDRDHYDRLTDAFEKASKPIAVPVNFLVAKAALLRALPKRLRARSLTKSPLAIVIVTPNVDWCEPVHKAVKELFGRGMDIEYSSTASTYHGLTTTDVAYLVRSGPDKTNRADMSGSALPNIFANGASAIAITPDVSYLPKEMVEAADVTIVIEPLRATDVRKIIRTMTGLSDVPPIADEVVSRLSPTQIATAIRPSSTPTDCVQRLWLVAERSMTAIRDRDVPPIEELAGYGEAKTWAMALKRDIDNRRADRASVPIDIITRSLLLAGPPGTGKTLMAAALARSCQIPLISTSFGAWQSSGTGHLGDTLMSMRKAFSDAVSAARSCDVGAAVLLIDEIDSIQNRTSTSGDKYDAYWTSITNGLLTLVERDNPGRRGVILIGATNFVERLDPALTRPGRFGDKVVVLSEPSAADFAAMMRTHLAADLPEVDLIAIARLASKLSGAEAARIVREARQTARGANRSIAVDDLVSQLLPPETRTQAYLLRIARHEAAHAVVGVELGEAKLASVTLCASEAEGATRFEQIPEQALTRRHFEAQILTYLAGRAADQMFYQVDAGSAGAPGSDLVVATRLCAALHSSLGLGDQLVSFGDPDSAMTSLRNDASVRKVVESDLQRLYSRAKQLVDEHRIPIDRIAHALVQRRFLSAEDVAHLMSQTNSALDMAWVVHAGGHNG